MMPPGARPIPDPEAEVERLAAERARLAVGTEAAGNLIRDILESLCRRDGVSLDSDAAPGEPARNYELADRLGIGHVFGLKGQP